MEKRREVAFLQHDLVEAIEASNPPETVENTLGLAWNHTTPMIRANQLTQKLGMPDRYEAEAGGVAVWTFVDPYFQRKNVYTLQEGELLKPTDVYSKLLIKDEEVPHLVPAPHNDFYYAYMYIDIPEDKVESVRNLTESVGYDTMSKEVYARCHFAPANLTSLYLMKQLAQGHKGLLHAQQEYVVLIPTLAKEEMEGHGLMSKEPGLWHQALTNYTFGLH